MTPQQPSPYRCIVSWCDFHCEIRSNHVCDKPPTCGCLYNSDIGAIWEPTSHSAIQQPGQQERVFHTIDEFKQAYFPKSYKKQIIDELMKRIDKGDKKAIKELAKIHVDEMFRKIEEKLKAEVP
jgi:hypothetical protein